MRAHLRKAVGFALAGAMGTTLAAAGCSNNTSSCSAPSSGTFTLQLSYAQTIPIDLFCDGGTAATDASTCAAQPHPFDGASWKVAVSGSGATVTLPQGSWSCTAVAPSTSPSQEPDGSSQVGTGCYLLLECGQHAAGDAGMAEVQVQILTKGGSDVVALVHDVAGNCCTDEYTGSWN